MAPILASTRRAVAAGALATTPAVPVAAVERFFDASLDVEGADASLFLRLTDRQCAAPRACRSIRATELFALLDCQLPPE